MSNQVPVHDGQARLPDRAMTDADRNLETTFAQADAERKAVIEECSELERQGKLDADATRRIEARLQSISDRLDKKVAESIAEIEVQQPTTPDAGPWQKTTIGLMLLSFVGFVGFVLESTVGESFVFSFTNTYRAAVPLLFAVLSPAFAIMWFRLERKRPFLSNKSTWLTRWLVMFPLIVAGSSAMVVFSPFGWSALAGWAIGTPSAQKTAKVLSEPRSTRRCDQRAKINIDEIDADICMEGRIVGPTPKVGDSITVTGRVSFFGFFIEEIRVK